LAYSSPNFDNNSALDSSISLKFGTESDQVTANTLKTFKIKGSNFNTIKQCADELFKT